MVRVAINGFGRVGRSAFRAALSEPRAEVVGVDEGALGLRSTAVVGDGGLTTVFAWYDNEFGFASRLLDVARHVASE